MPHHRLILALVAATSSSSVLAQTVGGPPIAYVKKVNNGDEIYLVNADGMGQVRIYKGPTKIGITQLDLRPGGNEIAWTENHNVLKTLAFDDFGRAAPQGVRTVRRVGSPCSVTSPDYHPTDRSLIFIEGCSAAREVRVLPEGASGPSAAPLFSGTNVGRVRWSRSGVDIYSIESASGAPNGPTYLRRRKGNFQSWDDFGRLDDWRSFNVLKTGERIVFGWNSNRIFDFATMTDVTQSQPLQCSRYEPHFGPQDTDMVYQTPHSAKGDYVMVGKGDCSGSSNALTGKGTFGPWMDWRD